MCSGDLSAKNGASGLQLEAVWGGDSDPESVYIYCYKVGVGAWKYKVNVKKVTLDAPVLNTATVTVSEDRDSYGQQDAKLTWTGIDNAASYKVYADGSLLATVTGTTYTESDITKSRTYYVQAVDASGVDGEKSNEVTAAYTTPLAAPTLTYTYVLNSTNSPGRQDSKLTWNAVSGASKYRIYDVPNSGETATVTITTTSYTFINLKQNHTYYVAALNSDGIPGKKSNEVTTDIDFTIPHIPEWSDATGELEGYGMVNLSWNYTYGFEPDAYDIYRDGNLIVSDYNELLYVDEFVAEGDHTYKLKSVYYSDKTAKTRKSMTAESSEKTINVSARNNSYELYGIQEIYNYDISTSTAFGNGTVSALSGFTVGENFRQGVFRDGYWYIAANTAGQILRFNADAGSLSAMASSATSIYSYTANTSAGLAIDDAGTFFLRLSSATSATSGNHFGSNLGTGILIPFTYKDKAATTAGTPTYVNINSGRCDYYAMKGDALGGTGHLYLALNGSPAYWDVTITNGAVAGTVTGASGQAIGYNNYIFPLAGRDDLIHCVRSDAYYNVKQGVSSTKIYSSYSRRNNSGGISAWFNNDLILITPQSLSSTPYGDFIVAKGYRDVSSSDPKPTDVLLDPEHIVPLAAVTQANSQKASVSSYVNSCWFGVTAHDTGDDAQDPYLDIYVYSPGLRFAKYRLYPYATLPDPKVTFTGQVNTGEVDGKDYEEITSLSGTVTWQKVDMGEEGHYGLEGFKVELADDTKNVIATAYVNSDGYACADESFSSPSGKSLLDGSTYTKVFEDLTAQEYAATVTAIYDKKTDSFTYTSEPVSGHVDNNYEAPAPTVYANSTVMVYSDKNSPAWPDPDDPAKYRTNRRIDINFDAPQFDGEENPRSYYQVWYKKPGQTDYQQLTGFTVVTGEHDSGNASSARRRADSSDSDTNDVSEVPGNYDFDNKGTVADSSSPAVVSLYYQPEVTADGTFVDASDDPTTWSYKVNATYAASNEAITKVSDAEAVTGQNGGATGVELPVVEAVMNESVYPAVTRTTFTASSVDAISAVTVYAADGSVAMTVDGSGQSKLTVDASALTPGIYFVSINGHKAHKLVKR